MYVPSENAVSRSTRRVEYATDQFNERKNRPRFISGPDRTWSKNGNSVVPPLRSPVWLAPAKGVSADTFLVRVAH